MKKWEIVYNYLKKIITTDNVRTLPSESSLVKKFSFSQITIRSAYKKLIEEGLVYSDHGKGYFSTVEIQKERKFSFHERFPEGTSHYKFDGVYEFKDIFLDNKPLDNEVHYENYKKIIVRRFLDENLYIYEEVYIADSISKKYDIDYIKQKGIFAYLEKFENSKIVKAISRMKQSPENEKEKLITEFGNEGPFLIDECFSFSRIYGWVTYTKTYMELKDFRIFTSIERK